MAGGVSRLFKKQTDRVCVCVCGGGGGGERMGGPRAC